MISTLFVIWFEYSCQRVILFIMVCCRTDELQILDLLFQVLRLPRTQHKDFLCLFVVVLCVFFACVFCNLVVLCFYSN